MSKGYMYILRCANGSYYTGSTTNLERRLDQHQKGEGANFTKKHLPIELVYYEEFQRIDEAFYREKQVQGWSRAKKEALINGNSNLLHQLAECKNETHYMRKQGVSAPLNAQSRSLSEVDCSLSEVDCSLSEVQSSLSEVEGSLSEVEGSLSEVEMNGLNKTNKELL